MDMQHEVLAKYKVTVFWGEGGGDGQKISLPGLKHGGVECIGSSLTCYNNTL